MILKNRVHCSVYLSKKHAGKHMAFAVFIIFLRLTAKGPRER